MSGQTERVREEHERREVDVDQLIIDVTSAATPEEAARVRSQIATLAAEMAAPIGPPR